MPHGKLHPDPQSREFLIQPAFSPKEQSAALASPRALGTTAPVPPPVTPPAPPTGDTGLEFLRYESPFEVERRRQLKSSRREQLTPADEARIREQERQQVQASIDAINASFAQEFATAEREGTSRLGSAGAIQARSGLIGSSFGEAQTERVRGFNREIVAGIEARKNLEVQKLFDKADERAEKAIEAQNTLARTNASEYLRFLEDQQKEARGDVEDYFKTGGTLDDLKKTEFKELLSQSGLSELGLQSLYLSNKPKSEILSKERVGNKFVVFTQKPDRTIESNTLDIPDLELGASDDIEFVDGSAVIVSYSGEKGKSPITSVKLAEGTTKGEFGTYKDTTAEDFSFTQTQKTKLLGEGFTGSDIDNIQRDIVKFGLDSVLGGLSEAQQKSLNTIIKGEEGQKFLTKEYFKSLFTDEQLNQAAKDAGFSKGGFLGIGKDGDTEAYLTSIEKVIESYRQAGFTDKEILEKMKAKK